MAIQPGEKGLLFAAFSGACYQFALILGCVGMDLKRFD
jgi:hypothetical protein